MDALPIKGNGYRNKYRYPAGPPVASSDWDGSDGWPLVQLWDTHTHIVKLAGNISSVRYQASGDCLVPVAFVIDSD